jgi:hypothetical protein
VRQYVEQFRMTAEQARETAGLTDEEARQALAGPPEHFHWHQLADLAHRDPELAQARWRQVKEAARDEVASGHLAARAIEEPGGTPCWDRARFLAVREELLASLVNPTWIERALIDQMAVYQLAIWS